MKNLKEIIEEKDSIIKKVAPEIDNVAQRILYRMALQAVDDNVEKFKQVLQNAEKLQPYKGNYWTGNPQDGTKKGAYAVILAMNENDIEKARGLEKEAVKCVGKIEFLEELSMISTAYIASQQK